MYGLLIPVLAQEFVTEYISASVAMVGSCIIIALMFWSNCGLFINIIIAFYVFQSYLIRPYVLIFSKELSKEHLVYIENMNNYFNPEAAAVVYWSLFSLLLAWLIGLSILKTPQKRNLSYTPKIFKRLDQVIQKGGLPFWFTWGLLFILNYNDPSSGLRAVQTGEGSRLFLLGIASLLTINFVCIYVFFKRNHFGLKPAINISVVSNCVRESRCSLSFSIYGIGLLARAEYS